MFNDTNRHMFKKNFFTIINNFLSISGNGFVCGVKNFWRARPCDGDLRQRKEFLWSGLHPVLQRPLQQDDEGPQIRQNEAELLRSGKGRSYISYTNYYLQWVKINISLFWLGCGFLNRPKLIGADWLENSNFFHKTENPYDTTYILRCHVVIIN